MMLRVVGTVLLLLVTALTHHQRSGWLLVSEKSQEDGSNINNNNNKSKTAFLADIFQALVLSINLHFIGGPWLSPWWRPLTLFLQQQWPRIIPHVPFFFLHGGPLGHGCIKVCEVLAAFLLWTNCFRQPAPIRLGSLPTSPWIWIGIAIFSSIVNLVLTWWSYYFSSSKGQGQQQHRGVHAMVKATMQRQLTLGEHVLLVAIAAINATCEEISSRGFWMAEFAKVLSSTTTSSTSQIASNICQALAFGVWHYHGGIPSGWMGVALTFTYGFIMGCLAQYYDGALILPIIAHTVADYFIFAYIARQEQFWPQ